MADGGEGHRVFRVARRIQEGEAGVTLELDGPFAGEPGQFVMVWLPRIEERPFSLVDVDPLTLTIAAIGPFTARLCALEVGDRLWVRGPFGRGYRLVGERPLLIGGGSGVASLALLCKRAIEGGRAVRAVVGARTAAQLMLVDRLRALGARVTEATDDGSLGVQGHAVAAVEASGWLESRDSLYACGPEPMLRAVARLAGARHLPCQVSLERAMKCGLGVCGNCHCGERLICRDGPVFSCAEAAALWATEDAAASDGAAQEAAAGEGAPSGDPLRA